jgi:hypothetical protein
MGQVKIDTGLTRKILGSVINFWRDASEFDGRGTQKESRETPLTSLGREQTHDPARSRFEPTFTNHVGYSWVSPWNFKEQISEEPAQRIKHVLQAQWQIQKSHKARSSSCDVAMKTVMCNLPIICKSITKNLIWIHSWDICGWKHVKFIIA